MAGFVGRQISRVVSESLRALADRITANDPSDGDINVHSGRIFEQGVAVARAPGSSIDPGLGFDTWRTPNADRPTLIFVRGQVRTDGTTTAQIFL